MDPIAKFTQWMDEARRHKDIIDATAMCVATADKRGHPSARIALLKSVDKRGFVFYTNMESRKSRELRQNPSVALCFYWVPLGKQIRIEGEIEQVSDAEADAYFATRPRESRIGAWASKQSSLLSGRDELKRAVIEQETRFAGKEVPRPPYWSGWRALPEMIEFWQDHPHRLHDRELYLRTEDGWKISRLYP